MTGPRRETLPPSDPVLPPATIGMLGGGQLGRYALVAARLAGYSTMVLDPDPSAPAGKVADDHLVAAYDDPAALDVLADRCAVVTIEFENPPAAALRRLADRVRVAPSPAAVATVQDRITEKTFLAEHGFAVAPFVPLVVESDLVAARATGAPAIVKTARLGYDGKGQHSVDEPAGLARAWDALGRVPCIVERRVPIDIELSALIARSPAGGSVTYPIAENHHPDGVLDISVVPARAAASVVADAALLATELADALDYVGVLAVELFVCDGQLLVNELAPRPHNSGHWTLDASHTDQFTQQIRAVTGAALGDPSATVGAVAMVNLLGDLWFAGEPTRAREPDWTAALADGDARLHLYGKTIPRPGRKMGHLTFMGDDAYAVAARALDVRRRLTA